MPRTNRNPASGKRPAPSRARRGASSRARRGAPRGNVNALRTGRSSKQLKALIFFLMGVPETRNILLHLVRLEQRRRDRLLAGLQDAVNRNARLLKAPSRRRSIAAVRRSLSPETLQLLETTQIRADPAPGEQNAAPSSEAFQPRRQTSSQACYALA